MKKGILLAFLLSPNRWVRQVVCRIARIAELLSKFGDLLLRLAVVVALGGRGSVMAGLDVHVLEF